MPSICFAGNYAQYSGALQVFRNIASGIKARGWRTGYVYHRNRPEEVIPDMGMFDEVLYVSDEENERENLADKMSAFANQFDIVHHSLIPLDWRFLFKMGLRRPQVETYHSLNGWNHVKKQYLMRLGANIERLPNVVTAISSRLANAISEEIKAPVATIYNGVHVPDEIEFDQAKRRYVTYSGRIAKDKGLDHWMKAALLIRENVKAAKFQWLGSLSPGCDQYVFDCLKEGCPWLEMPGFVEDIGTYYNRTDILMHLSPNEGLPMVIPEAMAYGATAIAYDVGDTRESGAHLVKSPEEAAERAIWRLTNHVPYLYSLNRTMPSERFSMDVMDQKYLDVYESLLGAKCAAQQS